MKKQTTSKPVKHRAVVVSPRLQWAFLVALGAMWLANIGSTLFLYLSSRDGFINSGTWLFLLSQWLLPFAYAGLAYSYVRHDRSNLVEKLFLAGFISVVALLFFNAVSVVENSLRIHFSWFMPNMTSTSLWSAYGHEWTMMLLGLAVFAAVLAWKEQGRKKRR